LTEGGENIGYGHISRCSAIHKCLLDRGLNAELLVDWHGGVSNLTDWATSSWVATPQLILDQKEKYSSVLVDSYKAPPGIYQQIKNEFAKLIVIDDYKRIDNFRADLIINPNVYGDSIDYQATAVGGNNYVILREAFRVCKEKHSVRDNVKRIMVTLGGRDVKSLLPVLGEMLAKVLYKVVFVCGNNGSVGSMKEQFAANNNFEFYGFVETQQMLELMMSADIAISACGQTLHELAYLGVPTIGICVGDDQLMNMEAYFRLGLISKQINWDSPELKSMVMSSLEELTSVKSRSEKGEIGPAMIDGEGVNRISTCIINACN
jgi:spore coat polysaccharide biosynthesis predicted glycosyltransferase SpsG